MKMDNCFGCGKMLFGGFILFIMVIFAACPGSAKDVEVVSVEVEPDIAKPGGYVSVAVNLKMAPGVEVGGYTLKAWARDVPPEVENLGWEFKEAKSPNDRPYYNSYRISPTKWIKRISGEDRIQVSIDTEGWPVGDYRLRLSLVAFKGGKDFYQNVYFLFSIVEEELLKQLREPAGDIPASDGSIMTEGFEDVDAGGIPEGWNKFIQTTDGKAHGIAEVSGRFDSRTFLLRDRQANIAVWSASDEVLPEDNEWAVQFDIYPARGLYSAHAGGAVFGLKRGERGSGDFLPVIQLDNNSTPARPIKLLGLGELLEDSLVPERWHTIVIRRKGTDWEFYLNGELKKAVSGIDADLRGFAFGSFQDWRHVARDVYYDNFSIGRFVRE